MLWHYYFKQQYEGVEIHGAITNISIKDCEVVNIGNRFQEDIESKVNSRQPVLAAAAAFAAAAAASHLGVSAKEPLNILEATNNRNREVLLFRGGVSLENTLAYGRRKTQACLGGVHL
ncbi:hypothetical protein [Pontibacter anaerobius]|uniref:FTP domain-containing protein n=1 Tax=Pontibacter anaerobius TaxID=2993940 RepID=A0ABT3RD67_9BACT|nr:hypothetical protein [Pontibacter anaerobius]MCX2739485.1 hypothetical protein [Pontibacter anaerobius]